MVHESGDPHPWSLPGLFHIGPEFGDPTPWVYQAFPHRPPNLVTPPLGVTGPFPHRPPNLVTLTPGGYRHFFASGPESGDATLLAFTGPFFCSFMVIRRAFSIFYRHLVTAGGGSFWRPLLAPVSSPTRPTMHPKWPTNWQPASSQKSSTCIQKS